MLSKYQLDKICQAFSLGNLLKPASPVTGGLLHAVLRLETETGAFAVKVLDRDVAAISGIAAEFERSEAVAAQVAAAGLPAIGALTGPHGTVLETGSSTVLVYPWADGHMLPTTSAGPRAGRLIGTILGEIHKLDIDQALFDEPIWQGTERLEWEGLLRRGELAGAPWAQGGEVLVGKLLAWEAAGKEASEALGRHFAVSHRDLDQKNVLWSDEGIPWLIDWESAGPVQPAAEAIAVALYWSGQSAGQADKEAFTAVLSGYRSAMSLPPSDCVHALTLRLAEWIGWLRANMERSIDPGRSSEERGSGKDEVERTLGIMRVTEERKDEWAEWCQDV